MFSTAALPTVPGHLKETHTKWNLPSLFISITLVPGGFSVKHKRMWWLNNSPRLNVFSAWHWEPLMVAVRLHVKCVTVTLSAYSSRSVSISVFHRVCVRVCACARGSVCVCVSLFGMCDGETDTCTRCSCQYISSFFDRLTEAVELDWHNYTGSYRRKCNHCCRG